MKLRSKAFISTGGVWIVFLSICSVLFYPFLSLYYLASFLLLGLVAFISTLWLLRKFLFNRLEQFKRSLEQNNYSRQVKLDFHDELTSIAVQINYLIEAIQTAKDKMQHHREELEVPFLNDQKGFSENHGDLHKAHLVEVPHYDSLTGLPNRVFFNEMLNKTISHAERHNKILAILFINLDRFKNINQSLNYEHGNNVLKEIAQRFTNVLRSGDVLARMGGDEFIVLLNDIEHPKFASSVAEKILNVCSKPLTMKNQHFTVTASIGISTYPHDGETLEELQNNADLALYKAKRASGGLYQFYAEKMSREAQQHLQLDAALRNAIHNNEFVLHYQPKLTLGSGEIIGVEALVRWNHVEYGLLNPDYFIPIAEETGLIIQIGEWALREACRANKSWQDQGFKPIAVAVNLSPRQFHHQDLAQLVANVLAETGLKPEYLELEITETAVMEDVESASKKLTDIKHMGVKISLDDFGTGHSSISYLKIFPIDLIKIDQTFIKGIPENQNDIAITSAIIAFSHNLGIQVVAEGVETAEQLQFLADHGCDVVQGFYLSRPLPEQKIVLQLKR